MVKVIRLIFTILIVAVTFSVPAATSHVGAVTSNNFDAHNVSTAANGAYSVYAADVDGDGDIDLMAALYSDDKIVWYENTAGNGSAWTDHTVYTLANNACSVYAADVDGDGDIDLMSASDLDKKIAWHENTAGDGSAWTHHIVSTSANAAHSVCAADVDGDGDIDLMSASVLDFKVAWYENTAGDGSAWDTHNVSFGASDDSNTVFAADVDGDGDIDLMASSASNNKIAWYENTVGDGSAWSAHNVSTSADGACHVYAADVDGDGDMDLMSTSEDDDKIVWYENTAGGGSTWAAHTVSTSADRPMSVHADDVDGDGDMDLMSSSINDDKIAWYENTAGDGSAWTDHTISTSADGTNSVYAADVDGDGDIDLMSASGGDKKIAWYENLTIHRSAYFPAKSVIDGGFDGARSVHANDVDRDGDNDLVGAAVYSGIAWWENDGSQTFIKHVIDSTEAYTAKSVYATDIEGDGDTDFLAAICEADDIVWWDNDGSQNFTKHVIDGSFDGACSVHAIDVDRDGDIDVLGAADTADDIAWFENTAGDGSAWTKHTIDGTFDGAVSVYATDVDSDGDIDVLGAADLSDTIAWFENTAGDGSAWTKRTIDNLFLAAWSVYATDVDSDGDIDVLGVAPAIDDVAWFENTAGDGSAWTKHVIDDSFDGTVSVYATDIDCDGDIDVLGAADTADDIAWWDNDGSQNFTKHVIDASFDGAVSVYATDVDSDGDIDVLGVAYAATDNDVVWYENKGGQFALATTDTAPSTLCERQTDDMLQITATHKGRSGDADMELATFELLFEESAGDPLTTAEANALIENLHIYLDDSSGSFEAGSDTLVTTVADLSLTAGKQTVAFTDGDASVQVVYGTPETYFVVIELTADAASQTPNQFRVTHVTESSSTAEDRDYDLPLSLEYAANVPSGVIMAIPPPPLITSFNPTSAVTGTSVVIAGYKFTGATAVKFGGTDAASFTVDSENRITAVVGGGSSGKVTVTTPDGTATSAGDFTYLISPGYGYFTDSGQSLGSSNSFGVALGDVDGDGYLDAFVANYDGQANKVWLNDGNGTFSDSGQSLGSSGSCGVALGDVDGDGDLDAFVANYWGPNSVWLNDGSGTFIDSGQSLGISPSLGVALGDVDGDGDLDAFVTNFSDFAVQHPNKVWLNDGNGTFSDSGQSLGSSASFGVALGDVDGDGDLDAFVANDSGQANKVWLNDGNGTFSDSGQSLSSSCSYGVALGDVDGDGDLDAFVANFFGESNKVWLNNGSGTFSDSGQSLGSSDSRGIALGDVDGDGDLDAFIANDTGQANKVWLNNGSGNFSESGQSLGSSDSSGVALGDVDGDGDLDSFVANDYGANKVWLNASADLSVTKDVDNAAPSQGDTINYTIAVTNNGPDAATSIQITDVLPAGITYVSDTPSTGTYSGNIWNVGTLAAGANATLQIVTTVDSGTAGLSITNTAELTSVDQGDPDSTPNNGILAEDDQDDALVTVAVPPGAGVTSPDYYLKMDMLGTRQKVPTSYSGKLDRTLEVTSADGLLTVTIPKGTVARQENGDRLTAFEVSVNENPPPPPENKNIIGLAYNFEPDGATFDPPITLTFTYDPETLPEGVAEEDLVLAFYDEDTGSWIELECVVDTENHTVTALVSHFTSFAIIGEVIGLPAFFTISGLSIQPKEVQSGEAVTVTARVTNTGGVEADYTAVLEVNGVREETQSISIAAGGAESASFTVIKDGPGDYAVDVNGLEGNFTVTAPAPVPAPTPAPPPAPTPTPTPAPEPPPVNWWLIGGVIAACVIIALVVWQVVIRQRRAR